MKEIRQIVKEPWKIIASPKTAMFRRFIPTNLFLKCMYRYFLGEELSLDNPKSYNEKLQWLKIYDRKPEYTKMVDKFAVKEYVANLIGQKYVIKTFGKWKSVDEINWECLPNRFVLKCTHDSAGLVICRDKCMLNKDEAKKKLKKCLARNYYFSGREWPYKKVKPHIIAEEYIEDERFQELRDYKFFTFNGEPKVMHLISNRQNECEPTYGDFFDMDYQHLDLTMGHDNAPTIPEKPVCFETMKQLAQVLAKGTHHLRVDFYEANGHIYFGELTFFQDSGFADIQPPEWNKTLGDWINLPKNKCKTYGSGMP